MKAATVKELKEELSHKSPQELQEICLILSKFKKENKELLTYLLFDSVDEAAYIEMVKQEVDVQFNGINTSSFYFIKKSIRKVLREIKKYSRYSGKKETQVELLIYFCHKMNSFSPNVHRDKALRNLYERQIAQLNKVILSLHEDLQYDYGMEMEALRNSN